MKKTVCHLSLEFPKGTNKKRTDKAEAVFSAPAGWIIKSYIFKQTRGLGPTSYDIDWIPAGSSFVSGSQLSNSFNEAMKLAAELDFKGEKLAALNADLNSSYSEFRQYSTQISASHQTISHNATIRGAGAFNGRTQYAGHLIVDIEEVPIPFNFAGVTNSQDGGNDIIIRGNSPKYVGWRLEGTEITNPNHFGDPSAIGGSVGALNNILLSTSDFYTGAFPAEFGDDLDFTLRKNRSSKNHQQEKNQMLFHKIFFSKSAM